MNKNKTRWAVATFVLTSMVVFCFFTRYLLAPNQYTTRYGGDGIRNAYVIAYHVKYDTTSHFSGMLYPFGDQVLYTDNVLLSTLLQKVQIVLPTAADNTVGILNFLMLLSIPLASVLFFIILTHWKLPPWFASLAAIPVVFLSPQMSRITGHYSLQYLVVLPVLFLLVDYYYRSVKFLQIAFYLVLVQIVFLFTHPYFLAMAILLQLSYALGYWYSMKASVPNLKSISRYLLAISTMLPAIFLFQYFGKWNDTVNDRPLIPWGYQASYSRLNEFVVPAFISFKTKFFPFFSATDIFSEGYAYLGLSTIFILAIVFYFSVQQLIFKNKRQIKAEDTELRSKPTFFKKASIPLVVLIICFFFFLVAIGFPFYGKWMHYREQLPLLPQFRSVGRFGWMVYYGLSLLAFYYLYQWYSYLKRTNRNKQALVVLLVFVGISYTEALANMVAVTQKIDSVKQNNELGNAGKIKTDSIPNGNYQALITLPITALGTDKIGQLLSMPLWEDAMVVSYHKGIPIIAGQMTRNSISQLMVQYQLPANELLQKELLHYLPNKQPILVLADTLLMNENEKRLLQKCNYITTINSISYYQLTIDRLLYPYTKVRQQLAQAHLIEEIAANQGQLNLEGQPTIIYKEGPLSNKQMVGIRTKNYWYGEDTAIVLWKGPLWNLKDTATIWYEASVWVKADYRYYGSTELDIISYDAFNKQLEHGRRIAAVTNDIYEDWSRLVLTFPVNKTNQIFQISVRDKYCTASSLLIRPLKFSYYSDSNEHGTWLNNFPIPSAVLHPMNSNF